MTKERIYQTIIGILVVVIIIGAWLVLGGRSAPSDEAMEQGSSMSTSTGTGASSASSSSSVSQVTTPSGNTAVATTESVSVSDQRAGMSVVVASVTLNQSSWIAIRDESGSILGAGLFPAGTQTDVSVPLLRGTEAGQHYQVLIYVDDGNKQFDFHKDALLTGADGSVVGTTFAAN